jgi:hypothetical protein
MQVNAFPTYDASDNPTECCPRFNPQGWNDRHLHLDHKPFVRARTRSFFHVPLNMGGVFKKTFAAIESAHANDEEQVIVLSLDPSPWSATHLFSIEKEVPGQDNVELSGDFITRVFEGPYKTRRASSNKFTRSLPNGTSPRRRSTSSTRPVPSVPRTTARTTWWPLPDSHREDRTAHRKPEASTPG